MREAPEAEVGVERIQIFLAAPPQLGRLVVARERGSLGRKDEEAHIEVQVRLLARGRDLVDVKVYRVRQHLQFGDAGLLLGLASSYPGEIGVAVSMSAGLQPFAQLGVEEHGETTGAGLDDER